MVRSLECLSNDPCYQPLYNSVLTLYTNPSLLALSKLHTQTHCFLKNNSCCQTANAFINQTNNLNHVTKLFIDLTRDVNSLNDVIQQLATSKCISVCDALNLLPQLNAIAYPCDSCVDKTNTIQCPCIPPDLYAVSFVIWYTSSIGKIISGCADLDATISNGLVFIMQINGLISAYDQLVIVGQVLKPVARKIKYTIADRQYPV
jgi:hypothetical protein